MIPVWELERDEQGMPVRMWLIGWRDKPPKPLKPKRPPKAEPPVPTPVQESLL